MDMLTQRRLGEVDSSPRSGTSHRLITLKCRHTFTVEYLDKHCRIADHYVVSALGVFSGPQTAVLGRLDQPLPRCPLCSELVTAFRYGRVRKQIFAAMAASRQESSPSNRVFTNSALRKPFGTMYRRV